MTEKTFLKKLTGLSLYHQIEGKYGPEFKAKSSKQAPEMTDYLFVEWMSGGITGGSWWDEGESHYYSVEGDPEPEFDLLDEALTAIVPKITYLQYKQITPLLKRGTRSENEYYGNSTNYTYKWISLQELFDKLKELKAI